MGGVAVIGADNWEVEDYLFDPAYKDFTCRLCIEEMKDRVYNPARKSDTEPYRFIRGLPGSSRVNEATGAHLRDKHGVTL